MRKPRLAPGFTLIELLAVMTILAILISATAISIPRFIDNANVTACKLNQGKIYKDLVLYQQRAGDYPDEGGIRFFLKIWKREPESRNETFAKQFICPGLKQNRLTGLRGRDANEWFNDWDNLDSTFTSYAGRDVEHFPVNDKNAASEVLVCDDNELADTDQKPEPNHRYKTIALLADGTTREFDIADYREKGLIPETKWIIPGPDCPIDELRTVSRDAPAPRKGTGAPTKKASVSQQSPSNTKSSFATQTPPKK